MRAVIPGCSIGEFEDVAGASARQREAGAEILVFPRRDIDFRQTGVPGRSDARVQAEGCDIEAVVAGPARFRIARVTEPGGVEQLRRQYVLPLGRKQGHNGVEFAHVGRQSRATSQAEMPLLEPLPGRAEYEESGKRV